MPIQQCCRMSQARFAWGGEGVAQPSIVFLRGRSSETDLDSMSLRYKEVSKEPDDSLMTRGSIDQPYFDIPGLGTDEPNEVRIQRAVDKIRAESYQVIASFSLEETKDRIVNLEMLIGTWLAESTEQALPYPFTEEMVHEILVGCDIRDDYMPFVVFRFITVSLKRHRESTPIFVRAGIIDFLKTCFSVSGSPELTWMVVTVFGLIFNSDRDVLETMVREEIDTILHVVRFIFEWEKVSAPVISVAGTGGEDTPAVYTDARREYVLAGLSCLVHILSVVTFPSDDLCMSCWHGLQRIENDFALVPEIVAYVNECFSKLAERHRPELVVHAMLDNNYYETLFDHLFILRKEDDIADSWFPICTCRILPLFRCLISANHEFYYRFADCGLLDMLMMALKCAGAHERKLLGRKMTQQDIVNILDLVLDILVLIDDDQITEHGPGQFQNIIIDGLRYLRQHSITVREYVVVAFAALMPKASDRTKTRVLRELRLVPDMLDICDTTCDKRAGCVLLRGIHVLLDFGIRTLPPAEIANDVAALDPATFASDLEDVITGESESVVSLEFIRRTIAELTGVE